jgi:hypothetical protein
MYAKVSHDLWLCKKLYAFDYDVFNQIVRLMFDIKVTLLVNNFILVKENK